MEKKVAILLSTYQGEKYLREQLDSLVAQTYPNLQIYIRDDGSKDSTVAIIEDYQRKYPNIVLEKGKNIGFMKSFFILLQMAEADYYAYCDQDDRWKPEKIQRAVDGLEKVEESKPALYFSNVDYYDENMQLVGQADKNKVYHFRNSLVECVSQGMTMVINQKTRQILLEHPPEHCLFHDWWTYMICSGLGTMVYDDTSLVQYRRHNSSVTAEGKSTFQLFLWRVKKFLIGDDLKQIKQQQIEFKQWYYDQLSKEDQELLDLFTTERYHLGKAMKKAFYPKRYRRKIVEEGMVRVLCLLGKL